VELRQKHKGSRAGNAPGLATELQFYTTQGMRQSADQNVDDQKLQDFFCSNVLKIGRLICRKISTSNQASSIEAPNSKLIETKSAFQQSSERNSSVHQLASCIIAGPKLNRATSKASIDESRLAGLERASIGQDCVPAAATQVKTKFSL
jgi:hypothetical protein